MTFAEFRNDPERVVALRLALSHPIVKEALAVMKDPENAPENQPQFSDSSEVHAITRLGDILGYARYHKEFLELAKHPPAHPQIATDYRAEN